MYYLLSELGLLLGLDALTFAMIFVMAGIGARLVKVMLDNLTLALMFFPILAVCAGGATFVGQALGFSQPFLVPYDELGLIRYISARDFMQAMMVAFVGMLIGLAGIMAIYRSWGHTG